MSHLQSPEIAREKMNELRHKVKKETGTAPCSFQFSFSLISGCTCSVGIGANILLSRLALKKAKPNGVHIAPFPSDSPV